MNSITLFIAERYHCIQSQHMETGGLQFPCQQTGNAQGNLSLANPDGCRQGIGLFDGDTHALCFGRQTRAGCELDFFNRNRKPCCSRGFALNVAQHTAGQAGCAEPGDDTHY